MTKYHVVHIMAVDSYSALVYSTTDLDFATAVARRTADRGGKASVTWRDADAWSDVAKRLGLGDKEDQ